MPPAEIDPFALPGRIQGRAPPIRTEDMSSDDEMGERLLEKGRNAALHQRAAGAAPSGSAARGRGARGGRRGGKASKAADHVLAAPLAVPGGPAPKRGSPLRAAARQLREDPLPNKRRRSLSGDVSAAPAAASSAALPSGAAPSDDTLQQMMQKRASRKAPAAAPAASPQDDSVVLVSPAVQISPDGPPRQSPPRESPRLAAARQAAQTATSPIAHGEEGAAASDDDDYFQDCAEKAEGAEDDEDADEDDDDAEEGVDEDEEAAWSDGLGEQDPVQAAREAAQFSGSEDAPPATDTGDVPEKVEVNFNMGTVDGDRFLSKVLNMLNLKGGPKLFGGKGEHGNTKLWQELANLLGVDMSNLRRRIWLGPTKGGKSAGGRRGDYESLMQQRMPYYRSTHGKGDESGTTTDRSVVEVLVDSLIEAADEAISGRNQAQKAAAADEVKRAARQAAQQAAFDGKDGRGSKRKKSAQHETPTAGGGGSTGDGSGSTGNGSKGKTGAGRPATSGKHFGYGAGKSGRGFTGHPSLNRLKMEMIVQKAWYELDQVEKVFYKTNPTPTEEATTESQDWPLGYKVENIDGSLKWKHLHRHEEDYCEFIARIAEDQTGDLETYLGWLHQQDAPTASAVALLHGALDAQPPISSRGAVDAMTEMAAGMKTGMELNAAVMQNAINDRQLARKDGNAEAERVRVSQAAEAERVRISQAAEAQKVRDAAAHEAQAERLLRKQESDTNRDLILAALGGNRAGPAAAAASSSTTPRERMLNLNELLAAGLVSQEEFDVKRQAILEGC